MRKLAALSITLLLLLPAAAAMADPAGDYEALVTAAKEGDPGTDYMALRRAYVLLPIYDPFGQKTKGLIQDAEDAYVKKDCKTALGKFREAIAINFTLSDAHALSADCMEQLGDKKGEAREDTVAKGLFYSIIASGNGHTPQTAFDVVTRHEEGVVIQTAGLNVTGQSLAVSKVGPIDKIEVTDPQTGKKAQFISTSALSSSPITANSHRPTKARCA